MKIVFFGTPLIAASVLENLLQAGYPIALVVTQPDRPQGRGLELEPSPVKKVAIQHNVPVLQPEKVSEEEPAKFLASLHPDLFIVVAYGEILKNNVLAIPTKGAINVHVSLLPKYRGAAPVQRAILAGEKETGVTIMYLVRKMDAGDIILQKKCPIEETDDTGSLLAKLTHLGSKALLEALPMIEQGNAPRFPQDESRATLAPKIEVAEAEIDWSKPSEAIACHVRAFSPKPTAWCWVDIKGERKRLKVLKVRSLQQPLKGAWIEPCPDGYLELEVVQLEGKAKVSGSEFKRGYPAAAIVKSSFS